jgi:hypothetical protein
MSEGRFLLYAILDETSRDGHTKQQILEKLAHGLGYTLLKDGECAAPLDDMPISVLLKGFEGAARAGNCLRNVGVHTVSDLLNIPVRDLIQVPNLGGISLAVVQAALYKQGKSLLR